MKGLKLKKSMFVVIAIIAIFVMGLSMVTKTLNVANLQKNKKLAGDLVVNWEGEYITIEEPFYQVDNENFTITDSDIITTAAKLLGKNYNWGSKGSSGEAYNNGNAASVGNVSQVDCSGLVWWTLKTLQKDGKEIGNIKAGQGSASDFPIDTAHWIQYRNGNVAHWVTECGYWKKEKGVWNFKESANGTKDSESVYGGQKVNILKKNDPVTDNYRWYNYKTANGNIGKLPAGVIVISAGQLMGDDTKGHAWISLGDLGTTDREEAKRILNERYNLNLNDSSPVFGAENSVWGSTTSTYWRIESSGKDGELGVRIDNGDPDYLYASEEGPNKQLGPVWAFQVASAEDHKEGRYSLDVMKQSYDLYKNITNSNNPTIANESNCMSGAKFTITQKRVGENGNIVQSTKDVNTKNGEADRDVFGKTEIYKAGLGNDKPDVYTISEDIVPFGYNRAPVELSQLEIKVYKKEAARAYVVDHVEITKGTDTLANIQIGNSRLIDVNGDHKWDILIKVDDDYTISIVVINEPINSTMTFDINKVDENDRPLQARFELLDNSGRPVQLDSNNDVTLKLGSNDGELDVGDYTYTLSEVSVDSRYVQLAENVKIKFTIAKNEAMYYVAKVKFENDQDTIKRKLKNEKDVTLELGFDTNMASSTVNIKVPNLEMKYDLALTKSIVKNRKDLEKLDMNLDGKFNQSDINVILDYVALLGGGPEGPQKLRNILTTSNKLSQTAKDYWSLFAADSEVIRALYDGLDTDNNGVINSSDITELKRMNTAITADRINSVSSTDINSISNSKEITTGTYNLNKVPYKINESDVVTYKITVYNEGDYDSKNIKITDYIPKGMVICDTNGNKVTGTDENGWTIVGNNDGNGTTKAVIELAKQQVLKGYDGKKLESISAYIMCRIATSDDGYTGNKITGSDILYNVAEITDSTPVDTTGNSASVLDRDSTENDLNNNTNKSNQQEAIDEYKRMFEQYEKNKNVSEVIRDRYRNDDKYNYEDDEDFERIVIQDSSLDLALRKSITKIGNSKDNMRAVEYDDNQSSGNQKINRLPKITEDTIANFDGGQGTGAYEHKKQAIELKNGDFVEYTIRVYNEGNYNDKSGYAKEITDYLPSGLKFIGMVDTVSGEWLIDAGISGSDKYTDDNSLGFWSWAYDAENNKVVFTARNQNALDPKGNLSLLKSLTDNQKQIRSQYNATDYNNERLNNVCYGYQELKLICKVDVIEDYPDDRYLTNIAEITKYADENGTEIEGDRDSRNSTVNITSNESNLNNQNVNLSTYYKDRNVNDAKIKYYPGLEDDDDFETVYVKGRRPGEYELGVVKKSLKDYEGKEENEVDLKKGTPVKGAKIKIKQTLRNTNGQLNKVTTKEVTTVENAVTQSGFGEVTINWQGVGSDKYDQYTIEEVTPPSGFKKLDLSGITFNVYKKSTIDSYAIDYITINKNGTEIGRVASSVWPIDQKIMDSNNDGNWDLGIQLDATGTAFVITIVDEPKSGEYHMNLVKKSTKDYENVPADSVNLADKTKAMSGAQFALNGQIIIENGLRRNVSIPSITTEAGKSVKCIDVDIFQKGLGEGNFDLYTLTETKPPVNFNMINLSDVFIKVYKKETTDGYAIERVAIIKNGNELTGITKTISGVKQELFDIDGDQKWDIGLETSGDGLDFTITVLDKETEGAFEIELFKYYTDKENGNAKKKLPGAEFTIKVSKEGERPFYTTTLKTDSDGKINVGGLTIDGEGLTYNIEVTEDSAPKGYIKIDGPIRFTATTQKVGDNYKLVSNSNMTVANAKIVDVGESKIYIEAENRTTDIDIHKGVKSVENQDSGYYYDEITKKDYTSDELKDVVHKWVIETTVPEDVAKYDKYIVTDPIDLTKLEYKGVDKVEVVNSQGEVVRTLTIGNDYRVSYSRGTLEVTYINKDVSYKGNFVSSTDIIGCKLRITFSTVFKVNNSGKLAVLDGVITNAENQATLSYDTGDSVLRTKKSENPEVHTGAVSVFKYDDKNGNGEHDEGEKALVGAKFKIASSREDAINGRFISIDGKELEAISNEHGIATFIGLEFGGDANSSEDNKNTQDGLYHYDWENASKKYYIVETDSPAGYERLDDVIEVTVSKNSSEIIDLTDRINEMEPVGNKQLIFDLALRKYIYSVTSNGRTTYPNPDRVPYMDIYSKASWLRNNTIGYQHTKKAITVKTGDRVTYRIMIFNEGNVKGYATRIRDFLPDGLELDESNSNGWKKDAAYSVGGKNAIFLDIPATSENLLNECGISEYLLGQQPPTWYKYYEVNCIVTKQPTSEQIFLTNRAEIAEDKAVEIKDGEEIELSIKDRDSEPSDVYSKHGSEMLDYEDMDYRTDVHYEGFSDDDDRETVTIEPEYKYEFKLIKVDEKGSPLNGATFKLEKAISENRYEEIYRGIVNGQYSLNGNKAQVAEINETYEYKITEESSCAGYENVLDGLSIIVNTYMNENKKMVLGVKGIDDETNYFNKYGFVIQRGYQMVTDDQTDLYERIKIIVPDKEYNANDLPVIEVTIPNDKIIKGEYKIDLKKVDSADRPLGNIPFKVNEAKKITATSNGIINVTEDNGDANGYVAIDKNNVETADVYEIEEVSAEVPQGIVSIKDPMTLTINKGLDNNGENYIPTSIQVDYKSIEGAKSQTILIDTTAKTGTATIQVGTYGGYNVPVNITMAANGVITVKVENKGKTGNYGLQIYKVYIDRDGVRHALSGTKFNVSGESAPLQTDNMGYTAKISKTITKDTLANADEYTIEEIDTGKKGVVGLKNPIKVTVTKTENPKEYTIDKIKLTEINTNRMSAENGFSVTLSDVELKDGRKVTVTANRAADNTITVNVENRDVLDTSISIKIKKVEATTGHAINGVSFKIKSPSEIITNVTTADMLVGDTTVSGLAYVDEDLKVGKEDEFIYTIEETGIPDDKPDLIQLTDYGFILYLNTKFDEVKGKYVIDAAKTKLQVNQIAANASADIHEAQKLLAYEATKSLTVSEDGTTLAITVKNESTTKYGLHFRKANINDNSSITGAKFTIYEDDELIKDDDYLGSSSTDESGFSVNKPKVLANTTHVYDIYETKPALGYDNILENTFIRLRVKLDQNGVATAEYSVEAKPGATAADVQKVKDYIAQYKSNTNADVIRNLGDNGFLIQIPNPRHKIDVDIKLRKHQFGNESARVGGAVFTVRRAKVVPMDYISELPDAMAAFGSSGYATNLASVTTSVMNEYVFIDKLEGAEINDIYYYEITESTVPTNFKSDFKKILVRVYVNADDSISSEIKMVMHDTDTDWIPYNSADDGDDVAIEDVSNNTVTLRWANSLDYFLRLTKVSFEDAIPRDSNGLTNWAVMPTLDGANFTIQQISPLPTGDDTIVDGTLYSITTFRQQKVNTKAIYKYKIVENDSPTGYENIFENMEIILSVSFNNDGSLQSANTEVVVKEGETVSQEKLDFAKQCVTAYINDSTRTVDIKIANQKKKNTFNLRILKVSDEKDDNGDYIKIPGVRFLVKDPTQVPLTGSGTDNDGYTDQDGYLTIKGLKPTGHRNLYTIQEIGVPDGVTPLTGTMALYIDTTGIHESDSPDDIASKLQTLVDRDGDGVPESSRVEIQYPNSPDSVQTMVEGTDVILVVQNSSPRYRFLVLKQDEIYNPIRADARNHGAMFNIRYVNESKTVLDGELASGNVADYRVCSTNQTYEYVIEEKECKVGYDNILEGYTLHVYLKTEANGFVKDFSDDDESFSHYELVKDPSKMQKYTEEEIRNNDWIKFSVTRNVADKSSNVGVTIINPYTYRLKIDKKDSTGTLDVDDARIIAERLENVNIYDLYGPSTDVAAALNQVAVADDVSERAVLHFNSSVTSNEYRISNNVGLVPTNSQGQLWRIEETTALAPYTNILENKAIIVGTYYRDGSLHIAKHETEDSESHIVQRNYYVINYIRDGSDNIIGAEDVTEEYLNYVDANVENVNGEWIVHVTVKDPNKFYARLQKNKYTSGNEPLTGAKLKLSVDDKEENIEGNSSYKTDDIVVDIDNGEVKVIEVSEEATVKGYKNILDGKKAKVYIENNNGKVTMQKIEFVNADTGLPIVGLERTQIFKHVTVRQEETADGYAYFKIYVQNPQEYEFELKKEDIEGTLLEGAEITVKSSHSGIHYLGGNSTMSFVEKDISAHSVITYTIEEISTVQGSAYINKFELPIQIDVMMTDNGPVITELRHVISQPNGSKPYVRFNNGELDYFDCYITPSSANELSAGEMQKLVVELQNPTKIAVEVQKTTSGENKVPIRNTKFTIEDIETHSEYTDNDGKINYVEEISEAGNYTIRVYEDEPANEKYINVLDGKYMKIDINVAADGTITKLADPTFYIKDSDNNYANDVQVDAQTAQRLANYCDIEISTIEAVNKLIVKIQNPITYLVKVAKESVDGEPLGGARFEIKSKNGRIGTVNISTNEDGEIPLKEEWIAPGVYTYEITETGTAGNVYDNILNGHKIVAYIKVGTDGIADFVADADGNAFDATVSENQRFYVKKYRGGDAEKDAEDLIRKYCSITKQNSATGPDEFTFLIENPINHKVKIIKNQYGDDGVTEEGLDGSRFTVIKNSTQVLLDNAEISSELELEEHYLEDTSDYYDIYENSSSSEGAYVNILKNKFVRISVSKRADGRVFIMDEDANASGYFEIYDTTNGAAVLLDRNSNRDIYDCVSVDSVKGDDDVYTVSVKVINPITIDVGVLKKQYGENTDSISNVSISVISGITGKHDITSTPFETKFSEGNVKPGTYDFVIKENNNPDKKYINILENKYAKVNVTISKKGKITINRTTYYSDNGDEDYTNDNQITDGSVIYNLRRYLHASVDSTSDIQKLEIVIENPVTLELLVNKVDLDGNGLQNASFDIGKYVGDDTNAKYFINNRDTNESGQIVVENGLQVMEAGVYRYEISEINAPGNQYVNILDFYQSGEKYKVVVYLKVNADGSTEFVRDAQGNSFSQSDRYKYLVRNKADNSDAPSSVVRTVRKYITVDKTAEINKKDIINVTVENPPKIDIDIIKTTIKNGNREPLARTQFTAKMDDKMIFVNLEATADKEYTYNTIEPGNHEFYITESKGVEDNGFINVLEDKFVKVYACVTEDGQLIIRDNRGNNNGSYFEIYEGSIDSVASGRLIDRRYNSKLYSDVEVSAEKQDNDVYKLNVGVTNPQRNHRVVINKKLFGNQNVSLKGTEFKIISTLDREEHTLTADSDGNLSFEQKQVAPGIYDYYITESKTAGEEFINVLKDNVILVKIKVFQDGTVQIVNLEGKTEGNQNRYYILDEDANQVDFANTEVDEFVNVAVEDADDMPELHVYIKDPQFYNFKLIKRDKDTNEKMNGVKFSLSVRDEAGNLVELKDANTLQNMNTVELVTQRVDGVDGVIQIPNILVDDIGTYTFIFEEKSTEGLFEDIYKSHAEDIQVKVTVSLGDRTDGDGKEFVVGKPTIITGGKYVDFVDTTASMAQEISVGVNNEKIKGSYDLVLNKLDKVTGVGLNGAEFEVDVEKNGELYQLYRANDSKIENAFGQINEVVIPNTYKIDNQDNGGQLIIENIKIQRPETYIITLTETAAPDGYMLLDEPIKIKVVTARSGEFDDEEYIVESVELVSGENHELVKVTYDNNEIDITAKNEYFDLALRKSITSIAYSDGNESKITEKDTENRVPAVNEDDPIFDNDAQTANYNHVKNHVRAFADQEVIYTLRVYNEGQIDGYAEEIKDHLPEGLEFVDDKFNSERGWMVDPDDESMRTIKTTYLSKDKNPNNERFNAENNLIKALDVETGVIYYKEIEVKCRISKGVKAGTILTNIAEISSSVANDRTAETIDRDSHTNPGANIPSTSEDMQNYNEDKLTDNRDDYVPGQEDDDDFEKIIVDVFDLALRKYITGVNDKELLNTSDDDATYEREPRVNVDSLKEKETDTAVYTHDKTPVIVSVGDIVTYRLQVYNEGSVDGYAELIKDDIPNRLEFVQYKPGDGSINDIYRWKMLDENDNEVSDVTKAKYVVSDYLSKANEKVLGENLLKAYDLGDELYSKYVEIQFRVACEREFNGIIVNEAQIADDSDSEGGPIKDRDSTPNEWLKEDDEDIENILVQRFDLSLRKWVTKAIISQNGKTIVKETGHHAEDDPEDVVKVDLKKSDIDSVVVKFEYSIRVKNDGDIEGYAKEIKDYIPEGLKFDPADNPMWTQISDNVIITDALKDTLLKKDETAEVTVVLTWINSKTNLGIKVNTAEISKDFNEYGILDGDSTPDNKVIKEDDIDDAPVMISIKTGEQTIACIMLAVGFMAIIIVGVKLIKKSNEC